MVDAVRNYFDARRPRAVVAALVFGSHARGSAHAESDLDIGLVLDRRLLADRVSRDRLALDLAGEIIAATHHNRVDIVVLNDASPELAAGVIRAGRLVYCADRQALEDFARTTLLRHADLRPFLERTRRLKLQALAR